MDFFEYRDNQLLCEDVPVARIAAEMGTPVFIYSTATFKRHYTLLENAFAELKPMICYSVKGCSNINICRMLAELGSGFDVVSGGELYRVQQAGGSMDKVVFAGVGKTDQEITQAISANIACFNIESEEELANIAGIAAHLRKQVNVALRINPDVDPKTHKHTTTGKREAKFGVDLDRARQVFHDFGKNEYLKLTGIHLHLGSPIYTVDPYVEAIQKTLAFIDELRQDGYTIDTIDIGGGFGADYVTGQTPPITDYADAIVPLLRGRGLKLILEPGRFISGNAGIFVTRTLYTKKSGDKEFAIVDGAMNDLIRPVLYDAFHFIWPVTPGELFGVNNRAEQIDLPGTVKTDVVGPVCETGDYLARDRLLPPLQRGDLLAVFTSGAYAFAMSSQYNSRPRVPEILVEGEIFWTIRRRETYEDLIEKEKV